MKASAPYGWTSGTAPHSCHYIAPIVLARITKLGVIRVLDVGCGNGAFCRILKDAGFDVTGVEYDEAGVRIATQEHPDIRFFCCGVQDDPADLLAQSGGRFDAVVSTEVVEHLFTPQMLPQFARRVLKPGGWLLVSTPYHGYLKNLLLAIAGRWDAHHSPLWHGGHIKFWSRATIGTLLTREGFDVVKFVGVGRLPFLWKSMLLIARLPEESVTVVLEHKR